MRFQLTPGNSLACRINTHRDGWAGTICRSPESWSCLATPEFRGDYCAAGDPRCFHVHAFDPANPHLIVEQNGAEWLLGETPDALDDQIIFFWGFRATSDRGVPERDRRAILFGAYRVQSVERDDRSYRSLWRIRPYPDGWARFDSLLVPRPRYESIGGNYINQIESHDVARILNPNGSGRDWPEPADAARFASFCAGYQAWIERAKERTQELRERYPDHSHADSPPGPARVAESYGSNKPFSGLGKLLDSSEVPVREQSAPAAPSEPETKSQSAAEPFIEAGSAAWIRATLGEDMFLELQIAFATRELVILRGDPGVGKSHLALRLLDDPERERTLVVPVSATWRGREDLLGYVNPIHGRFDRTPFTQFLETAAEAWVKGDQRVRVVVFEEFNLSQPEHWLADVLAVSQYDDERDRRIQLAGPNAKEARDVLLSPAVRFIATVNNDHTTRVLSPRVLDRAAIVPLELTAKEALRRIDLDLSEPAVTTIADLDFLLRARGAGFSIRSARALARCLKAGLIGSEAAAIDVILVQQVLSKLHLAAHDAGDLALLRELEEWCNDRGTDLARCSRVLASWKERLDAGLDVLQA